MIIMVVVVVSMRTGHYGNTRRPFLVPGRVMHCRGGGGAMVVEHAIDIGTVFPCAYYHSWWPQWNGCDCGTTPRGTETSRLDGSS